MTDTTTNSAKGRRFKTSEESFNARIARDGDCIVWVGGTDANGYGQLRANGRATYAHRYAWERANGPIPAGMVVDHMCWNPLCVNVKHLRLASRGQNVRYRQGPQKCSKTGLRGVTHSGRSRFRGCVIYKGVRYSATFDTIEEAHEYVKAKRLELYGAFAGR